MNQFTADYNAMIQKFKNSFILETINESNIVYKFPFNPEELNFTYLMALEKSKYTMANNQKGTIRPPLKKVDKAFQGMLAEYSVHKFMNEILQIPYSDISRYDIERESFRYNPNEEYDIKINKNLYTYFCEIRSSIKVGDGPKDAFDTLDVIGPYFNDYKIVEEQFADFYLRPIFVVSNNDFKIKEDSIIEEIKKDNVSLYIVTGAIKSDFQTLGYNKTMGQGTTKYWAIKISNLGGFEQFVPKFNRL